MDIIRCPSTYTTNLFQALSEKIKHPPRAFVMGKLQLITMPSRGTKSFLAGP
jgi:hypothetical protein